jgi:hypothetical protein
MAEAGAGNATTAGPSAAPARRPPWWKRVNTAILAAGALAVAILAIVAVVELVLPKSSPNPENRAIFTAVRLTPDVPLSEYQQRASLTPLGPAGEDAGATPAPELLLGSATGGRQTVPATTAPSPPTTRSPTTATAPESTTRSTTTRPSTTGSGPTSTGPATSTGPSISVGPSVEPSDSGWVNTETTEGDTSSSIADTIRSAACAAARCEGSSDGVAPVAAAVAAAVDVHGNPVSPDVAAQRVVQILRDARSNGDEPIGVVVAADLELIGLRHDPVFLTWEMWQYGGTTRLHGDWLNENLAYRLEPNTDHDSATLDMWIPLPPDPGPYFVRVELSRKGFGLVSADSATFE